LSRESPVAEIRDYWLASNFMLRQILRAATPMALHGGRPAQMTLSDGDAGEKGRGWFPDALVLELAQTIGVTDPDLVGILAWVLRRLPQTVQSFRKVKCMPSPSQHVRELERIERNPLRLRRLIQRHDGSRSIEGLRQAIREIEGFAVFFYHFANGLCPEGHAERHIDDGSAHRALLDLAPGDPQVAAAARRALDQERPRVAKGRGGDRHRRPFAATNTIDHLVGFYTDLTGKLPGYTIDPVGGGMSGPLVFFLRACLQAADLPVSDATLRRRILEARERPPGSLA
jgi:hypothetical protein